MKCPIDQIDLTMSDRQGIEIDYCPQCRGVWLDRGELDKIIERTQPSQNTAPSTSDSRPAAYQAPQDYERRSNDSYSNDYHKSQKRHKKENFLGDLFDF